jgi:hypothetical protein
MSNVVPLRASPDESSAALPQRYEAARAALAECDRIDECKDWADQAAAIASYARQAHDDSLAVYARRIRARAYRRMGELINQCPSASTENLVQQPRQAATGPSGYSTTYAPATRTEVAADAGLSERQRKTAQRVASVPAAAFDAQVDSPRPPSVTQLASQGTAVRDGRAAAAPPPTQHRVEYETLPVCEAVNAFVIFCGQNEPISLARACSTKDAATLRNCVSKIDRWLDRLLTNLPRSEGGDDE